MESVGLREANLHFANYIKKVRSGAEIILTDRGTPVAIIKPLTAAATPLEVKLEELATAGMIHLAEKPLVLSPPVVCNGETIAATVAAIRQERG